MGLFPSLTRHSRVFLDMARKLPGASDCPDAGPDWYLCWPLEMAGKVKALGDYLSWGFVLG